jgi:pyruvate dehydrogenase E1 component
MESEIPQLSSDGEEFDILRRIEKRLLWLSTYSIHYANNIRVQDQGIKIGGHQASSSSVVSLMTAMFFRWLRTGDRLAIKPHASPVLHAAHALRGDLPLERLKELRAYGGLQAYPSRKKDFFPVDFSTGSLGLPSVTASFAALMQAYISDHFGPGHTQRFISLVGDAELDEGNIWEALAEEYIRNLGNIVWIVDLNRQSLDRVVPDGKAQQIRDQFRLQGWYVVELKYGKRLQAAFSLPGGEALRRRIDGMLNSEYQSLIGRTGGEVREGLLRLKSKRYRGMDRVLDHFSDEELPELFADLGGHDLACILEALGEADGVADRPVMILAYTIKGWGLPIAGDPLNHSLILTDEQIGALRVEAGLETGQELTPFPEKGPEADVVRKAVERYDAKFQPHREALTPPPVPGEIDTRFPDVFSTQEAFGSIMTAIGRDESLSRYILTASPDVAVSTNLGGWINRNGVYHPKGKTDFFALQQVQRLLKWEESPQGRHIELGISENNLMLLLAAFGLSKELCGVRLCPIGTLYDTFIGRCLDALRYAVYNGGRFIVVATPSGTSLSPEGGAHQSILTPTLGLEMPGLEAFEPAFAVEVEWILLDAVRRVLHEKECPAFYLRLSTKQVDQSLLPGEWLADSLRREVLRQNVLHGGYLIRSARAHPAYRPGVNGVNLFAAGAMLPEAVAASEVLAGEEIFVNVYALTSADRLYADWRESQKAGKRSRLAMIVGEEEVDNPVVSVIDGHSHVLSFLGGALGAEQTCLGSDQFGQSGLPEEIYEDLGFGQGDIEAACRSALL